MCILMGILNSIRIKHINSTSNCQLKLKWRVTFENLILNTKQEMLHISTIAVREIMYDCIHKC